MRSRGQQDDRDLFAVFWWRDRPLGHIRLTHEQRSHRASLADLVAAEVAATVGSLLFPDAPDDSIVSATLSVEHPLQALDDVPDSARGDSKSVSVVICTRDRPAELRHCLESVSRSVPASTEILVVDNDLNCRETRAVVDSFPRVRYIEERRTGLSAARNTGIRMANEEIIVFTDDDATVTAGWVEKLTSSFDDPRVMAAMGLVLPAELETPAQAAAQLARGWLTRGYQPEVFDRSFLEEASRHGGGVWTIGAGANMAIRKQAVREVGWFDERLGAGKAGCSEDSEFWYRLLAAGWQCRYEPSAVVFHTHRRELDRFCRQAQDYMRGHVAALFVQFARHRDLGNLRRAFLTLPHYYLGRLSRDLRPMQPQVVRSSVVAEVTGFLQGLTYASAALAAPPRGKRRLRSLLADNPFPHPLTEGFFYREKMRAIHRVAPDRPFVDVLELGGGRSGLTHLLYPDALVTNVDQDATCAAAPQNQNPRVRFVCTDATRLPFDDGSFDAVTMFDVLEHIEDDGTAIDEALRVLRPGGCLLVTTPNENWRFPYYRAFRRFTPTAQEMQSAWGHVRQGYAVADLEQLLGVDPERTATFISPITVVCHDLGFSKLPGRARRAICASLAPVTWIGYALHKPTSRGTETATAWRKPE